MKKCSFIVIMLALSAFCTFATARQASAAGGSLAITSEVLDNELRPGGETTVLVTVSNPSTSDMTDVRLAISAGPNLAASDSSISLGDLSSGYSKQTSFSVTANSSAAAVTSYLTVKATYYISSARYENIINTLISITTAPILQIDNVEFTQVDNEESTLIGPGSVARLKFDLVNNGDGSAKDIRISLDQSSLFAVSGSGENFVGELKPDNSVNLSFVLTVDPSTTIGTHQIPVSLTYLDETFTENSATKYIGLTITGETNLIVLLHSQEASTPGTQTSATVKIINAGNQEVQFLTVNILSSTPLIDVAPQTVYIGSLNSDDYDTQKFSFKTQDVSPGNYPLKLEVYYQDTYGNGYTEQHSVNVRLYSAAELPGEGIFSPYTIAALGFLIILVGYFTLKKFRKKRK